MLFQKGREKGNINCFFFEKIVNQRTRKTVKRKRSSSIPVDEESENVDGSQVSSLIPMDFDGLSKATTQKAKRIKHLGPTIKIPLRLRPIAQLSSSSLNE
jgi:hypothetical protein